MGGRPAVLAGGSRLLWQALPSIQSSLEGIQFPSAPGDLPGALRWGQGPLGRFEGTYSTVRRAYDSPEAPKAKLYAVGRRQGVLGVPGDLTTASSVISI